MIPRPRKATFAISVLHPSATIYQRAPQRDAGSTCIDRGLPQAGAHAYMRCACDAALPASTMARLIRSKMREALAGIISGHAGGGVVKEMAVSKEQVLAALESVTSPEGIPLPRSGTLSEVVVGDAKVFFS